MKSNASAPARWGGRQPLLLIAFAFAGGIWFSAFFWRPPVWWIVAGCGLLACSAYLLRLKPRAAHALGLGAMFAGGALCLQLRNASSRDATILTLADGREMTVIAHVVEGGNWKSAGFGGRRQSLDLETEQVTDGDHTYPLRSGLRLNVYSKERPNEDPDSVDQPSLRGFHYGERLRFPTKLYQPRNFRNPGAFDYRGYLADRGIVVLGSAHIDSVEVLGGFEGSKWQAWRNRVRSSIVGKVHQLWPEQDAALVDAMVIGEDAFIEPETKVDFQRSGTFHVLVVSGMNLSILAFVCFWTLRRLRVSETWAGLLTIALSVAYALLTDVGPPIWRATFMLILVIGARLMYRERSMLNAIGGAAFVLLLLDPRALFGSSFQLTFLSVLVIAGIGIPLLERTTQPYRQGMAHGGSISYDAQLAPRVAQFRLDVRMIAGRIKQFSPRLPALQAMIAVYGWAVGAAEILLISAIMQMGLVLPMAFWFHRATVVGLPANALVVPLTELLMPAAVIAVATAYVGGWLARIPALITGFALHGIVGTVKWLGGLNIADTRVATPETAVMIAAGMALVVAALLARRRTGLVLTGIAGMVVASLWICGVPPRRQIRTGVLEMTAIDVGQGDSTLLVTPEGRTLLLDAGGPVGGQGSSFDFGEQVVSPYLWARGISRLDAVIVSHGHSDHIGGMPAVLRNFRPREMWIGVSPENQDFKNLVAQARSQGMVIKQCFEGDEFNFGGVHVRVFAPARGQYVRQAKNNDSMVLKLSYANSSMMLEGDAEKQLERRVVEEVPGSVSLLKVAHNGSTTSTTPEWIAAVRPKFAVISVGARNTFGHPRMETLIKLAGAGVRTYRTDLDGAVSFYLSRDGVIEVTNLH